MTRYHTTSEGNVPFTASEETARDAEEATWAAEAEVFVKLNDRDRAAAEARNKRNDLLSATDWTANSDVTMTTEMAAYRTLLRNLPAQSDFPTTINWPTAP